jgi:hypothetical protein
MLLRERDQVFSFAMPEKLKNSVSSLLIGSSALQGRDRVFSFAMPEKLGPFSVYRQLRPSGEGPSFFPSPCLKNSVSRLLNADQPGKRWILWSLKL